MNVEAIKKQLLKQYPGVNIKENADDKGVVIEIVGEIDRKLVGSNRDVAVVVTDSSVEHTHDIITEEYEILKGSLRVFRNGQPTNLGIGDKIIIEPGTNHYVVGDETWFYCYSVPDWFPGDYHPVEKAS